MAAGDMIIGSLGSSTVLPRGYTGLDPTGSSGVTSNLSDIGATQAALQRYVAQQQTASQKYAADAQKAAANQASQLQYNLGANQLGFAQSKYNQLFPMVQSAFGTVQGQIGQPGAGGGTIPAAPAMPAMPNYGGSAGGGSPASYGGGSPAGNNAGGYSTPNMPQISAPSAPAPPGVGGYPSVGGAIGSLSTGPNHPVLSEDQVNQQVNQQRATNDAGAAGQLRRQTEGMAGRGVGANSPLQQALEAQIYGQNLNANTTASTNTRLNAAQLNAANNQAYDLANQQSATALGTANIAGNASMYGAAQAAAASQYGSQAAAQASMYGSGVGAQANMYGSKTSADASIRNAINAAQASNYNAGLGYQSSTYGSQLGLQGELAAVQAQQRNSLLAALAGLAG